MAGVDWRSVLEFDRLIRPVLPLHEFIRLIPQVVEHIPKLSIGHCLSHGDI